MKKKYAKMYNLDKFHGKISLNTNISVTQYNKEQSR